MLNLCLAAHNSLFDLLLGISFDRRLFWHKTLAVCATVLGWTHGLLAALTWPEAVRHPQPDHRGIMMVSGFILGGICVLFLLFSFPSCIRRKCWNIFHLVHVLMTILLTVSAVLHSSWMICAGLFSLRSVACNKI